MGHLRFLPRCQCLLYSTHVSNQILPLPYMKCITNNIRTAISFYPEISHRSLEEIDLIFAKGHYENMSCVKAAQELPELSVQDMRHLAIQCDCAEANEI